MIIAMENGPIWPILRLIIYLTNLPVQNCHHLPAGRNIHQNCNYMSYRRNQQAYGLGSPFHWLWAMAVFFASVSCWTVCIHSTAAKQMDGYLIHDFGYVWLCVFIFNQVDKIETYFFRLRVRATQVNCQKNNTNQAPTRTSRRERQFSLISLGPVCWDLVKLLCLWMLL
jgi:hypothetical protein